MLGFPGPRGHKGDDGPRGLTGDKGDKGTRGTNVNTNKNAGIILLLQNT